MSQADIMDFLDKNPGRFYDTGDVYRNLNTASRTNIHIAIKKIIKRQEYEMMIMFINKRLRPVYRRIKDNGR